jgi:predicted metalloprotease
VEPPYGDGDLHAAPTAPVGTGWSQRPMTRPLTPKIVAAILTLGLVAPACAQEARHNPLAAPGRAPGEPAGGTPATTAAQPVVPDDLAQVTTALLDDIEAFWVETYPQLHGEEWQPLRGGYAPYGPDTRPLPCDTIFYGSIAENAFYCPGDDVVAWDEVNMMPPLAEGYGGLVVGAVLAHELGHAAQYRSGYEDETLWTEQQANCFGGAWVAWFVDHDGDDRPADLPVDGDTLDFTLAGLLTYADPVGTSASDPDAHGSGFDQVNAFQEGYAQGAERCAEYEDPNRRPAVTEIPFRTADQRATRGNRPTGELLPLLEQNLNLHYARLLDLQGESWEDVALRLVDPAADEVACDGDTLAGESLRLAGFYCEDEHTVVIGSDLVTEGAGDLQPLEEIGDFAVGTEVGRLYAQAAQVQAGSDGGTAEARRLADCLTGAWARQIFPTDDQASTPLQEASDEPGSDLVLAAGDLDETVTVLLTYGRALDEAGTTALERFGALRLGFQDGVDACQEQYGQLGGG